MRTNTTHFTALVIVVATVAVGAQRPGSRPGAAEARLKAAMIQTLVDGDASAAISRYRALATEFDTSDRAVAAKALLELAGMYEKLRRPEARETYAAIARRYPDQPAATTARAKVGATTSSQTALAFTEEHVFEGFFPWDTTPDERTIVGTTSPAGKPGLHLRDAFTGAMTTVLQMAENGWIRAVQFSPDTRSIAFEWEAYGALSSTVFVVDAVAGATGRAVLTQPRGSSAFPDGWAPDGKSLLVTTTARTTSGNVTALVWVPVSGGDGRVIKTFEAWRQPQVRRGAVSPNGALIVYSALATAGSRDRYLYVCDAAGQNERVVVRLGGVNAQPVWTPDSAGFAFLNTRTGPSDLMFVAIPAGGTTSLPEPVAIQRAFGSFDGGTGTGLTRISNGGDLLYAKFEDRSNQEVIVERNPAGRVELVFTGQSGTWSPDGRKIAFYKPAAATGLDHELVVRELASGAERVYARPGLTLVPPIWFGDSRRLVVRVNAVADGAPSGTGGAFYMADTATGTFTRLLSRNTEDRERAGGALSPDGTTLYLAARSRSASAHWNEIVAIDLASGTSRLVFIIPGTGFPDSAPGMALSPDGTTLVLRGFADDSEANSKLVTIRVDGTNYRELFGPIRGFLVGDQTRWASDGQSILFTAFSFTGPHAEGGWRVMRISPNGGSPQPDGIDSTKLFGTGPLPKLDLNQVSSIDVSPDGTRILFSSRPALAYGFWKAKNFLAHTGR